MERDYRFPETRAGLTRKFSVRGLDVYLTVNPLPSAEPGEVFIKLAKQGSTLSGLMQAWAVTVSAALQRGVPWADLREKYTGTNFEPNDHRCTSLIDAVARNIDDLASHFRDMLDEVHGQRTLDFNETDEET
ncbi:MAG: hypothetical protein IH987_05955 [Planctomycetes bacterium]|nr:hypothetical protein [Planctomycetota bacterium]